MRRRQLVMLSMMAVAAVGLAACADGSWGASASGLFALALLAAPLAWTSMARAGAPVPCSGYEEAVCNGGVLRYQCCPEGAKCNFTNGPHVDCGGGLCVAGRDVGRCAAPQPIMDAGAKTQADCRGSWEKACVDHRVTEACIMMPPTNYTGPPQNPRYRMAGPDRCTTHLLLAEGFAGRGEVKTCAGTWTKVCLGGAIVDKCVPKPAAGQSAPTLDAATYVSCPGDDACAVGTDAGACSAPAPTTRTIEVPADPKP